MINFAVVFVVLYIFALKPLSKLMTERAEKIKGGVDDAKKNAETLRATTSEYEAVLAHAKIEANKIFTEGKKEAETKKAKMLDDAKAEVASLIANGKKTLEAEKIKMVEEAKKEIVNLAMSATEKLIKSKQDLNNL